MDEIRRGDLALFRVGRHEGHVGVVVSARHVVHAHQGQTRASSGSIASRGAPRLVGFFRHCGPVHLFASTRILGGTPIDMTFPEGLSLAEILDAAGVVASPFLRVCVGDTEVPLERSPRSARGPAAASPCSPRPWGAVGRGAGQRQQDAPHRPHHRDHGRGRLHRRGRLRVRGRRGGGVGRGLPRSSALGAALTTTAVTLAGSLAINALIPPGKPRLSAGDDRNSPTITGARNELRPFGVVPQVLGSHRMAPLYGAAPYTEVEGDDQYLRLLFVCGKGPVEVSDLRIGETPLDEYEGIEYEVREGRPGDEPLSIFSGSVLEEPFSIELLEADGCDFRTSEEDADELSVDVTFPSGLLELTETGERDYRTVACDVEYSPAGLNDWRAVNAGSPDFSRGLDFLFRTPSVEQGGVQPHAADIAWGLGFPGAEPAYLPSTGYSWEASGWVFVPAYGEYRFGIDCSDAGSLTVDGQVVAYWLGTHSTAGGGTPDYAAHSGPITLGGGYHQNPGPLRVPIHHGRIAIGWKKPGDGSYSTIPAASYSSRVRNTPDGVLRVRWFDTSAYLSSLATSANRACRSAARWPGPWSAASTDVRVRRVTPDTDDDRISDAVFWTALRTVPQEDPIQEPGVAKIALRIRATDQLSGVVDSFNCQVTSILPDWDPSTGTWIERGTSNNASCYPRRAPGQRQRPPHRRRPRRPGRAAGVARVQHRQRVRVQRHHRFPRHGPRAPRRHRGRRQGERGDARRQALGSPRPPAERAGAALHPPQLLGLQGTQGLPRPAPRPPGGVPGPRQQLPARRAHRLRRRLLRQGPRRGQALDDRHRAGDGVRGPRALRRGGHRPGVEARAVQHRVRQELRPEVFEFSTDVEHIACSRGDMVLVTHDVLLWGLAFGRVVGIVEDTGGNLLGLRLDTSLVMDAGEEYVVRVRLEDGSTFLRPVVTAEGEHTEIAFQQPVGVGEPGPKAGDLFMFGALGLETREVVIKSIDITKDLAATIVVVDHAPAVHTSDQGPIPPYDPGISLPPTSANRPETPVIEQNPQR